MSWLAAVLALLACGKYPSLPGEAEPGSGGPSPIGDGPGTGGNGGGGGGGGGVQPKALPAPEWPALQTGLESVALGFGAATAAIVYDPANEEYQPGTARIGGNWWEVGLRMRGDGARFHPKHSWKTKLPDGVLVEGQRTRNFVAEYLDTGYLSDPFAYGLMYGAAAQAPRARFVTLDVNGEHQGVYVDVQQVDKHFLDDRGLDHDSNIYRCGARDCEMGLHPIEAYQYPWEKKTNESEPWDDLWSFLRELSRTPQHEFAAWLERNLEVDRFVRFYASAILLSFAGVDDSGSYLVHDRASGKWTFVPWDLNNSRLVFWRGNEPWWGPEVDYAIPTFTLYDPGAFQIARNKSDRYGIQAHPPFSVLFQRIWDEPSLRNRILDEVERMLDTVFSPEQAMPRIDALAELVRGELPRDPWVDSARAPYAAQWLKQYVTGRTAFLRKQIPLERHRGEGGLVVNAVGPGAIEIYNREDAPRSLAGLALTSDCRFRVEVRLEAVEVPPHGKVTLPFATSADGGEVGLFDAATSMPVDVVFYAPLAGRTYARAPDGAAAWAWR